MKERAHNALKATRALGIPDKEVMPVLKDLFKVFDKNWEPIEAEDYRALIDAYFEFKENKAIEDEKKSLMKDGVSERPCKRQHFEEQEDQASTTAGNPSQIMAVKEGGGTSITGLKPRTRESSQLCSESGRDRRTESGPLFSHGQGKSLLSNHHGRDHIMPRTAQIMNNSADFAKPSILLHTACPGTLEGASTGNKAVSYLASQCDASGSGSNNSTQCDSNFAIASSTLEQVKIFLNCDFAVGQQNFQIPDFNAVLKTLEDRYARIDKLVSPQFSVTALLKDLCESYLKLGTISKVGNSLHSPGSNRRAFRISNPDTVSKAKASKPCRFSNSRNLVNAQQGTTAFDGKMSLQKLNDITKGAENVKISLIDEVGNEGLPKFIYMPQNIIYQNAYMQISLARIADEDCCSSCSGDCLSCQIPCACARETGGEFAYTPQGLLKQEFLRACVSMKRDPQMHHFVFCQDCPLERSKNEYMPDSCKGHLVRKFIKECWRKCGCDMNCGNRVVQRGITCSLQVFMTCEGKGWGVRTLNDLPKGTFVCEYVGEILTNTELYERNMQSSGGDGHTYPVTLDADWGSERILRDEEALCLDATFSGNVARFINHRCVDANLIDIPVEVETPDRHYYHLAFFTTREVRALEELTWDYGIDFDDHDHPIKAFPCCCGSASCRDVKGKRLRNSNTRRRQVEK